MDVISEWGYHVIDLFQARNPLANVLFVALFFTGEERFFMLLIPVLYWLVDKRLAIRFALLFLRYSLLGLWGSAGALWALVAAPEPPRPRLRLLEVAQ